MRLHSICTAAAVAAFLSSAAPAGAQWLEYPTPGLPRTASGELNVNAPTPRTSDGKPDLSGIWGTRCQDRETKAMMWCAPDVAVQPEFGNIARSLPGGAPVQPWVAEQMKKWADRGGQDDPATHCLPMGPARFYSSSFHRRIIQVPGLMIFLTERNALYRQVYLDGRPLPEDPNPSWTGYSTARWEGDTLVIESNGYSDRLWLDRRGLPLTEGARLTERIRRPNFGTLEAELTVNDLGAYTKPWTVKFPTLHFRPDTDMLDYLCNENEKSTGYFVDISKEKQKP